MRTSSLLTQTSHLIVAIKSSFTVELGLLMKNSCLNGQREARGVWFVTIKCRRFMCACVCMSETETENFAKCVSKPHMHMFCVHRDRCSLIRWRRSSFQVCLHICTCVCVCAYVCVCACVRACVCACVCLYIT